MKVTKEGDREKKNGTRSGKQTSHIVCFNSESDFFLPCFTMPFQLSSLHLSLFQELAAQLFKNLLRKLMDSNPIKYAPASRTLLPHSQPHSLIHLIQEAFSSLKYCCSFLAGGPAAFFFPSPPTRDLGNESATCSCSPACHPSVGISTRNVAMYVVPFGRTGLKSWKPFHCLRRLT